MIAIYKGLKKIIMTSHESHGVSNHRQLDRLFNRMLISNVERVSISQRHHVLHQTIATHASKLVILHLMYHIIDK